MTKEVMSKSAFVTLFCISAVFAQQQQAEQQIQQPLPQAQQAETAAPAVPQQQAQQFMPSVPPVPAEPQPPQLVQEPQKQVEQSAQPPKAEQSFPLPQVSQPSPKMFQECKPADLHMAKIGVLARFNMNSFSYGGISKTDKRSNKNVGFGIGVGGGVVRNIPINSALTIAPEISFWHRKLYSDDKPGTSRDEHTGDVINYEGLDVTEFALSVVPIMAQIKPFEKPFYIAVGVQMDIPIYTEYIYTDDEGEEYRNRRSIEGYGRTGYDLGTALGLGYDISDKFNVNFRTVIGLKSLSGKSSDKSSYNQYGIGVTFF